jgi:hypothetical protein
MSLVKIFGVGHGEFCGNQYVKKVKATDVSADSNPKPDLNLFPSGD